MSTLISTNVPATGMVAVSPSDSTDLSRPTRGLFIGGAGNVSVVPAYDSETAVVFNGLAAGALLPIVVKRVNATDTTATNIVALY